MIWPKIWFLNGGNGDGGYVTASDPDGAYLRVIGNKAQVVIVGPMQGSPGFYEVALREHTLRHFALKESSYLGLDDLPDEVKRIALRRGMVSLKFEEDADGLENHSQGQGRQQA